MKIYEYLYWMALPLLPAFNNKVRDDLKKIMRKINPKSKIKIIDIGGRKSPHTTGLNAEIVIVDKHPESQIQADLNLGLNEKNIADLKRKRSNISRVILHDMTKPIHSFSTKFDVALNIEVIEHVQQAEQMIKNICDILKHEGILYLTTPNGDYIKNEPPNYNPDHVKHYTKIELQDILSKYFSNVSIEYGVKTGKHRVGSMKSWELRHPVQLFVTWISSIINRFESVGLERTSQRTAHLFAICVKK